MMKNKNLHIQILGALLMLLQALMLVVSFVSLTDIPQWLKLTGNLHPVLLHLPISFIILLIPISIFINNSKHQEAYLFNLFLHYTALFATITALLGLLAASSNDYDKELLIKHKWLSIATALLTHILIYIYQYTSHDKKVWSFAVVITAITMIIGSHFGGSLTHGEGYLDFNSSEDKSAAFKPLTDSTLIYDDVVNAILTNKCLECHNDKKSKGGLNLASFAQFQKGGKSGAAFISGDPAKSLFIQRALLSLDDKKHMPPKGKAQLTEEEIYLFKEWIIRKADTAIRFHQLDLKDTLRSIIQKIVQIKSSVSATKHYDFKKANEDDIKSLNSPFRRVLPIDVNSPALVVKFYLKEKFNIKLLEECTPIAKQIIEINLSSMPVDDKVFELLSNFENLEKLNLNGTLINGEKLGSLSANKKLAFISLASTKIQVEQLYSIGNMSSLKNIYLWNSQVSDTALKSLQLKFPKIKWDIGYVPDDTELLKLTPPTVSNAEKMILNPGEQVALKHPLPGAQIRYTVDGTIPDSINGMLYTKPFDISGLTQINAVAVSKGWLTSNSSNFTFFVKGIKIDSAIIINQPAERYRATGSTALIDFNKGTPINLNLNWLGFRDQTMKAGFNFNGTETISTVVLSLADNTGAYVFPPEKIIVKGGLNKSNLTTIATIKPPQPTAQRNAGIIPVSVNLIPGKYHYVEIEAINVQRLPNWHPGKKEKGWVFVDEVFFY